MKILFCSVPFRLSIGGIEAVLRMTRSRSQPVFKPLPSDDPKQRRPDISLAEGKLGWQPKVTLEDGLAPTIAYFRGVLAGVAAHASAGIAANASQR